MTRPVPILDFVPALSPRFARPNHLAPLADLLERASHEPIRAVISASVRHGKTELLLHAIARALLERPSQQIGYISYAAGVAQRKSRKALALAKRAGVPLDDDALSRGDWRTGVDDGGVLSFGIDGQATGEGFHLVIVDDPIKNRATAESALEREKLWEAFNNDIYTRLEPDGSCIVCHARWHEDDLGGRLIRAGWPYVNLPALDDDGRALWPERYSADALMAIREQVGEYAWASLYQGNPRPRGGAIFRDASTYTELPAEYRTRIGVDFAYSAKTRADYSVAIVLASTLTRPEHHYVLEVIRKQVAAPDFAGELAGLRSRYPGATMRAFIGGTEKGTVDFMERAGIAIDALPATADKFVRAQPAAALWNAGRILVPAADTALWVTPLLNEVLAFTGVGDKRDDQVDALAGALHGVAVGDHAHVIRPQRRGIDPNSRWAGGRGF